jgi:hypothetical protein
MKVGKGGCNIIDIMAKLCVVMSKNSKDDLNDEVFNGTFKTLIAYDIGLN